MSLSGLLIKSTLKIWFKVHDVITETTKSSFNVLQNLDTTFRRLQSQVSNVVLINHHNKNSVISS
jgi:hypothetical protein